MLRYSIYSDPKHLSATIVELFKFSIDPVLKSTEIIRLRICTVQLYLLKGLRARGSVLNVADFV